jgi:hypothetical protein
MISLRLLLVFGLAAGSAQSAPGPSLRDPGFEALPAGTLAASHDVAGWEVQRHGRDVVQERLRVVCLDDSAKARSGSKCVSLSIPKDTVGFEFVTIGQRHALKADVAYEASVWVRWIDGPEKAPDGASAVSGHPSAIVSFWVRHKDGTGDFAGRDDWLFDNRWTRLSFRFRATDPEQRSLLYVSLLPNQKPAGTTVLVDDFALESTTSRPEAEPREGNLVQDPAFERQKTGSVSPPWYFANMGGKGISGRRVESGGRNQVTLTMGKDTSNLESAQIWQHLDLREGVRYEVTAGLRWDNFSPDAPAPIVNYGIFHDASRTWYGPVDQVLVRSGDWTDYRFVHVPPYPGPWKLYVQLNGWGNFRNGVTVSVREVRCVAKD